MQHPMKAITNSAAKLCKDAESNANSVYLPSCTQLGVCKEAVLDVHDGKCQDGNAGMEETSCTVGQGGARFA